MENRRFLKRGTRVASVVASVFLGLAIASMIIIGVVVNDFREINMVGAPVVLFLSSIMMGIVQLKVFFDYKAQSKMLCADGIFDICLTLLMSLIGFLSIIVSALESIGLSLLNITIVIAALAGVFGLWKIILACMAFKHKFYNAFIELLVGILWIPEGVFFVFHKEGNAYGLIVISFLLCLITLLYILYSYVFKEPDYLITEKGKAIMEEEIRKRELREARVASAVAQTGVVQTPQEPKKESLEDRLSKLKALRDKDLIDEDEYQKRKKAMLDEV